MKVPTPTSSRTRAPSGQLAYLQGSGANGLGALASGIGNLGESVAQFEGQLRQRADSTDRFNSLMGLSKFQNQVTTSLTELKRTYRADGKGYTQAASDLYTQQAEEYLKQVPAEQQQEMRLRIMEGQRPVVADSLKFQYQAGDAWFKQGVNDELNKSKILLDQDPASLEAQRAHMSQIILATDLPEIEKQELMRQVNIGLEAVTYKSEVRKDSAARGMLGVGAPTGVVDRIIGIESSGRADAKNPNSSAEGAGQFIDGTWLQMIRKYRPDIQGSDDEIIALKRDPALSREMTTRYAEENSEILRSNGITPTDGAVYLAHFLGPGGAVKVLSASPDTPVSQLLGSDQISANQSILAGKSAGDIRSWAARKMQSSELATDARFQNLPYEDRLALRADAENEALAIANQEKAAAKAARDAAQNELYLGLLDGVKGQMDIDNARANGTLNDFASVDKANGILKERTEGQMYAAQALTKLQTPGAVFDPTNTDDNKGLNALTADGIGQLTSGNQNYVNDTFVPLVQQTGIVPSNLAGTLAGMIRGADNNQMGFALDALAMVRNANPQAFDQRFDRDIAQKVDLWEARRNNTPREELLSLVRGGMTQSERQVTQSLQDEARGILSKTENGVPNSKTLLEGVVGQFGSLLSSPNLYANPAANKVLEKEFQTYFIDAYGKVGNTEKAVEMATTQLKRDWAVSSVGTGALLMKYPPESVYRKIGGSWEWMNVQARKDLGLAENEGFQLMSDDQTRLELQGNKADPTKPLPSYRVFTVDSEGVARERIGPSGRPMRIRFETPKEAVEQENREFDYKAEKNRLQEIIANYPLIVDGAWATGSEVPAEDTQAYEDAKKKLEELEGNSPMPATDYYKQIIESGAFGMGGL